jgi:hypothetical protein
MIGASKIFVLPRLDYTMMDDAISKIKLKDLDKFIRNIINDMI